MNSYQHSFGKCVSPPITLPSHSEVYAKDERKPISTNENKPIGALKIFYESKHFHLDEPQHEWNFTNPRRKKQNRLGVLRAGTEGKKKSWKNEKKRFKHEESAAEEKYKKPRFLTALESQMSKTKPRGLDTKLGQTEEVIFAHTTHQKTDWLRSREIAEKYLGKIEPERLESSSLFTLPISKQEAEKKTEIKVRAFPFSANKPLSRKTSEKMSNTSSEMKPTISDFGKRRINEILKSHAQKNHLSPTKTMQIKDYTISGSNSQKKVQNVSSEGKESKTATKIDKNEEVKHEATKPKPADTEETKEKPKELKEKGGNEEKVDEKKKLPGMWLKLPQSNELERRLKNSWQESSLFSKDLKVEGNFDDEKISAPLEKDDDTKIERRVTYTDRLLLLKMLGKNLEEKKETAVEREVQLNQKNSLAKTPLKENSQTPEKKTENALIPRQLEMKPSSVLNAKEITIENKSFSSLKDPRYIESEHVYKTKPTRSMELRDLVAQAIKEHKIFCIFDNHTYIVRPVREELLNRGWLEVIPDRRLIPRRRPPPMGPMYERDKTMTERNCNTIEAILAAKETFADEIQDTVSHSSFRFPIEKPKIITSAIVAVNKKSEESLNEALSLFRIIPPTTEKKKTNLEIREFVTKYQTYAEKERESEKETKNLREKEKNSKTQKKEKVKPTTQGSKTKEGTLHAVGPKSLQQIWDSINENKKIIMQAASEIKGLDMNSGGKMALGVLYESAQKFPAIEGKKEEDNSPKSKGQANTPLKTTFSEGEAKSISKIIQASNARIHFMWLSIKPGIHLKCFNYSPEIINKFQKTTFCTKIGLWSHLNNMQWYAHEVNHPAKSPRMYNTGEADDMQAFFQDFQLTACIGMLKWLSDTFFERGLKGVQTKRGKVPLKAFEFAIKQCEKYVRFKENEELNILEEVVIHKEEWNTFLQWFYIITNDHGKVQESSSAQLMVVYTKAVETLKLMKRHWPEIDIDGRLNIWIMKPYCASCGRGIFMTNNVYYISQHSKYIVQKYIEKPLLIYNTKFDIRQWFMITKLTPLEIWMYKECYLRFCSQPFALRNLHESVHLSNNSVQRKYISLRDPHLPDQNMWDSNTFKLYLKTIGQPTAWEEIIYPGMRDAIVSTMLAAQDTFDGPRKSWFEVYGADFMLSANLREGPWLIEINENPAMDPSTKVTARLCPQMLRDVIKVVVDKRANKNANTGQWELIYRQNYSPSFGSVDLDVRGKKIARVPFTTKVSVNVPSSLPKTNKTYDPKTVGSRKLYEFVKTFGTDKKPQKELKTGES